MPKILISGAGVAGPALALRLSARWACTVVERAPALRVGGQAVDFRGPVHREVLERLELWKPIHERRTRPGDFVLLGRHGEPAVTIPALMMSGDVEIERGDLCRLLFELSRDRCDYRFGDRIVALADAGDRVDVTFASGREESFDVVVGADGLHSGVRVLAFGPDADHLRHCGYRVASYGLRDAVGVERGSVGYSEPGRAVTVGVAGRSGPRALLVATGAPFGPERRDVDLQKRLLHERFADMGWKTDRVLAGLDAADDLYVDAIATAHVERWSKGRVVLLGDAAAGGTLGGQGTSVSIVGAYVLGGELERHEPATAFARYEAELRPYAERCQKGAARAGGFFAPRTRLGLLARDTFYGALTSRPLLGVFEWMVKDAATDLTLPEAA